MSESDQEYDSADSPEFVENPPAQDSDEEDDRQESAEPEDESIEEPHNSPPAPESSNFPNTSTTPPQQTNNDTEEATDPQSEENPVNSSSDSSTTFQVGVPKDKDDEGTRDMFGEDLSDDESDVEMSAALKSAMTDVKYSSDKEDGEEGDTHHDVLEDEDTTETRDSPPVKHKRRLLSDSDIEDSEDGPSSRRDEVDSTPPPTKKSRVDDDSASEGEEDVSELQEEVAELGDQDEGEQPEIGGEREVGGEEGERSGEDDDDDNIGGTSQMSDWDIMMQRRKDAMARARRRRRKDVDITANDDHIMAMIHQMKEAGEEDRRLNMGRKAATKKLQMLPIVITHLKKADLVTSFIECGILSALADWITPLPDHSLPHLKIRESVLDVLKSYPTPDGTLLKSSKVGKAVMLLYRHPKETRKNREKAGKIINEWARPIFGLASDFKSLSRDEREERDYAHISQSKRKRLSTGERRPSQDDDFDAQKPGDKGWVGRARVPMPSTNDYVVRPKWNVEQTLRKKSSKKVLNRYEKQLQKEKQRKTQHKTTHAVSISVEGRNMPL